MRKILRATLLLLSLLVWVPAVCGVSPDTAVQNPESPEIVKMDPPNWWVSFTPQVMLLIKGSGLQNAKITTSFIGVHVSRTSASENGHYVFLWLEINTRAKPGNVPLHIQTASGTTDATLPLLPRRKSSGNFQGLSADDVIYLIMPDRFADGDPSNDRPPGSKAIYDRSQPMAWHGGDLRGVQDHLLYLRDLGSTTIWLTPIWKNSDNGYHGYHPVDMYAVDPHMGSLGDYQELVARAHSVGIKVVMDFVGNHTGPDHPWAGDPPSPAWFHGSLEHHTEARYDFLGITDPHASPREYKRVIEGWFVNVLPDLNTDDPKVAQYLTQNGLWWMEISGLDAIRIDTFPYSSRKFWADWHHELRQVYPNLFTIGEVSDQSPTITAFFQGGRTQWDGIDSGASTVFDYPLYYRLRDVLLRGAPIHQITNGLQLDWLYPRPDLLVPFIGNHDKSRFMGEPGSTNQELIAADGLLLTLRGIPEIYYGDEIGMAGGDDPDNRRDFPGGFPGDTRNAFTDAGRTPEQKEIFDSVRALLRLRRDHPALRQGQQWNIGWDETYFAYLRSTPNEKMLIVFNNATNTRDLKIPVAGTRLEGAHSAQLAFGDEPASFNGGTLEVSLPPRTLAIYEVK